MSWSPDSDSPAGDWSPEPEGKDARPEVVIFPNAMFRLRLAPLEHDRAKPGEQAFATYLADAAGDARPIAVGMLSPEAVTALVASDLFAEPTPLMLRASESEDGQLHGVVSALLPQEALERFARQLETDAEPWAASVPTAPDPIPGVDGASDEDEERNARAPFALGALFRFAENRKHPGDLAAEAADLFMTVLNGGAVDADQKKIDNLISGL
jgi:hypothetical protein